MSDLIPARTYAARSRPLLTFPASTRRFPSPRLTRCKEGTLAEPEEALVQAESAAAVEQVVVRAEGQATVVERVAEREAAVRGMVEARATVAAPRAQGVVQRATAGATGRSAATT